MNKQQNRSYSYELIISYVICVTKECAWGRFPSWTHHIFPYSTPVIEFVWHGIPCIVVSWHTRTWPIWDTINNLGKPEYLTHLKINVITWPFEDDSPDLPARQIRLALTLGSTEPARELSRVQWNHCLRTYCDKNFRGLMAGLNPFCQLIEIRTLGTLEF